MRILTIGAAAMALAACGNIHAGDAVDNGAVQVTLADNGAVEGSGNAALPTSGGARATVAMADGKSVGTVTASTAATSLTVTLDAHNLPAGRYGVHLHGVGACESPGFESAGGHWNPTGKQHGRANPRGAHYGDLPNLTVSAGGTGSVTFTIPGATMAGLLDADGAAFVIHAKPDDYRTDPSGNSGDRIACGVFAAG